MLQTGGSEWCLYIADPRCRSRFQCSGQTSSVCSHSMPCICTTSPPLRIVLKMYTTLLWMPWNASANTKATFSKAAVEVHACSSGIYVYFYRTRSNDVRKTSSMLQGILRRWWLQLHTTARQGALLLQGERQTTLLVLHELTSLFGILPCFGLYQVNKLRSTSPLSLQSTSGCFFLFSLLAECALWNMAFFKVTRTCVCELPRLTLRSLVAFVLVLLDS